MLDESRDLRSDQRPTRQGLRPFFLWTLIAAIAVMAVGSSTFVRLGAQVGSVGYPGWGWSAIVLHGGTIVLVMATLVLAPIAAVRSRSQGRDICRSYGVSAVFAAALGVGFAFPGVGWSMVVLTTRARIPITQLWPHVIEQAAGSALAYMAVAITSAWLIVALTGVGRRPLNGFEQLGLGLGLLILLTYLGRHVLNFLPWFF